MFAIWREAVASMGFGPSPDLCALLAADAISLGLDNVSRRPTLGSPVVQTPEKSGLPSARRGGGADRFAVPSAFRGVPAVGYLNHCAARGTGKKATARLKTAAVASALRESR